MRAKIFAIAFTAVTVAGCDKATDPNASLSAVEARAIASAIVEPGSAALEAQQSQSASLSLTPTRPAQDILTHAGSFDFSGGCDLGGTATIAGSGSIIVDTGVGTIDLEIDATGTYADCEFETDNDIGIALDGSVDFVADRHLEQGLVTGSQSYAGSLGYVTSDGKEGTCPIDIAASFSLSQGAASRTITGNVCDQSVDVTTTWTAGT